jgi:hypothetical protein
MTTAARLTPPELEAIDRNHTRLAAFGDRGRTRDLFAAHAGAEDLTLVSEIIRQPAARPAPIIAPQLDLFTA